jgi:CRISPR-associated endonuclease/helicase Cas3
MDERGPATLHVLAPPWTDDPPDGWFKAAFPRAAYVYPAEDQLWLTADALRREGGIRLPERARDLLEAVYGVEAEARTPAALLEARARVEADAGSKRSIARVSLLKLAAGYCEASGWDADTRPPTRLGEATRRLYLARATTDGLAPLEGEDWDASHVSLRVSRIAPGAPTPAAKEHLPDEGEWDALAILRPEGDGWAGEALDPKGRRVTLAYSRTYGLRIDKEETKDVQPD